MSPVDDLEEVTLDAGGVGDDARDDLLMGG